MMNSQAWLKEKNKSSAMNLLQLLSWLSTAGAISDTVWANQTGDQYTEQKVKLQSPHSFAGAWQWHVVSASVDEL